MQVTLLVLSEPAQTRPRAIVSPLQSPSPGAMNGAPAMTDLATVAFAFASPALFVALLGRSR